MKHQRTLLSRATQVLIGQCMEEMRKFLAKREAAEWRRRMGKTTLYANYRFNQMMLDLACLRVPPRPIQWWMEQLHPTRFYAPIEYDNQGRPSFRIPEGISSGKNLHVTYRTGEKNFEFSFSK